jgi:hypothetical protein
MKTLRARILLIGTFFITACPSVPERSVDLGPTPAYQKKNSIAEILESESDMPEWAIRYFDAGLAGIETLPEYEDSYVFISRQIGNRLEPLRLWAAGFSVEREFPRLVSARIQERFIAGGNGNPVDIYGRYFETVVKNASDTSFEGASWQGSFWVKKRVFGEDGVSPVEDVYEYLIMTLIDKETLRRQINMLLITARPDRPSSRDQSTAAMRLRLNFYEGF